MRMWAISRVAIASLLIALTTCVLQSVDAFDQHPIFVIAGGCSGSTAVTHILQYILEKMGTPSSSGESMSVSAVQSVAADFEMPGGDSSSCVLCLELLQQHNHMVQRIKIRHPNFKMPKNEVFKPSNSCFLTEEMAALDNKEERAHEFVQTTNNAVNALNCTWVAKMTVVHKKTKMMIDIEQYADYKKTVAKLLALDTRVVSLTRANDLDRLVCMIRDQIGEVGKTFGYPLDSSGEVLTPDSGTPVPRIKYGKVNGKLERASYHTASTAFVYPDKVVDGINLLRNDRLEQVEHLQKKTGFSNVQNVQYERLTAFETGDLNTSAREWFKLLKAIGHPLPTIEDVASILENSRYANSMSPPHLYATLVSNWEEVRQELLRSHDDEIASFIRS